MLTHPSGAYIPNTKAFGSTNSKELRSQSEAGRTDERMDKPKKDMPQNYRLRDIQIAQTRYGYIDGVLLLNMIQ